VQVFDHQHQGPVLRHIGEQGDQNLQRLLPPDVRRDGERRVLPLVGQAEESRQHRGVLRQRDAVAAQQVFQAPELLVRRLVTRAEEGALQEVDDGSERRAPVIGGPIAHQPGRGLIGEPVAQGAHQARLADAGLAEDQHGLAAPRAGQAEAVEKEMAVRDRLDSTRRDGPLTRTQDAIYVDTTGLSIDQVVDALAREVERVGLSRRDPR